MIVARKTPPVTTSENALKNLIIYQVAIVLMVVLSLFIDMTGGPLQLLYGFLKVLFAVSVSTFIVYLRHRFIVKQPLQYEAFINPMTQTLLLVLLLPTETSLIIVFLGIIIIQFFNLLFLVFAKRRMFNPVLMSFLILQLFFRESLPATDDFFDVMHIQHLTLNGINWATLISPRGIALLFTAFLFIYLSMSRVIQIKTVLFFIVHLFIFVVLFFGYYDLSFLQMFSKVFFGTTLIAIIFLVSEPQSTPETQELTLLYAFLAAVFTAWLRVAYQLIEASLYALVFVQFATWILEQFQHRSTPRRRKIMWGLIGITWGIIALFRFIRT